MIDKRALQVLGGQVLKLALAVLADVSLDLPGTPTANKVASDAITRQKKPTPYTKQNPHWTQTAAGKKRLAQIGKQTAAAKRYGKHEK